MRATPNNNPSGENRPVRAVTRPGFTMVEILLAMFILTIGLIMVASIFPVAGDWTRRNVEETNAANIAQNAVAIIQAKYSSADVAAVTATVQAMPLISTRLPLVERAFAFGSNPPYPASNPTTSLYFWVPLIRQTPGQNTGDYNKYDLYILVFKKGAQEQTFNVPASGLPGGTAILTNSQQAGELFTPYVMQGNLTDAMFVIGSQGIGQTSGTVFRKIPGPASNTALVSGESVLYVPGPDPNSNAAPSSPSPLVYIYQTTVSF